MSGPVDAGPEVAREPDEIRTVPLDGRPVAVACVGGRWYAFDDACPHHDCPLADGYLEGNTIECGCHGSVFDVVTGAVLGGPAVNGIEVYQTFQRDGRVFVGTE